jgi:iron complex outermembrane recepter protein
MSSNYRLQTAVRLALSMGTGALAVGLAPGAMAQGADEGEVLEEIVTTGSRIKRADLDSASPVTVVDREMILSQGITDVGDLLQRMPSMAGSPIGTTTNNGGNGEVQIDLRGMGVDRTLTLVNGFRTVDRGDYQTIPANMIERVEILKDGASAVYGADAVAGVVNIITRRDFEGVELSAQNADFFDMDDGAQNTFGLLVGKVFDSGNVLFGGEYVDQSQAFQSDAPWDFFQNSYYIYPEGCEHQLTQPYPTGCYPLGSSRVPQSDLPFYSHDPNGIDRRFHIGTPASGPYEVGLMDASGVPGYNYAPVNYIQTPYQRTNLFAEAHFDLTDTVRFNTMVRGNFRESSQELAPLPYTGTDPMWDGFYTDPDTLATVPVHGISQDNYYLQRAVDLYNATNNTDLPYEPVINPQRRMIETNRRYEQEITQIQVMAGFEGEIADMDWEVHYNTGFRSRTDVDFGQFSGARLFNALGPSADLDGDGQPECYADASDPDTEIVGCVPMNLFGGGSVDPVTSQPVTTTLTQDMIDYVSVDLTDTYKDRMEQFGASIAGELMELPGGPIGWAAGVGYYAQHYAYSPDSGKQSGAVTGNVGAGTDGSLYNNSVFGELLLPVFDNGTQSLDLKAGARYDDYNAFDGEATWQLGVEFQALESLKLRATGGTVFRAPTVANLYGGLIDSFPTYSDPCIPVGAEPLPAGCDQVGVQEDSQLRSNIGGNPDVVPETGESFTAGFVFTPEFGDTDVSLTMDYWQIDIEDGISSLGVQNILNECYLEQNASACSLVTRDPDYSVGLVIDQDLNVAEQGAKGVDTEIRAGFDTAIGQFEAAMLWSHLLERRKIAFPGQPEQDLSGRFTDPTAEDGGAYAENKMNFSIQYYWGDLSVGWLGEYISELDADTFCNCDTDGDPSNNGPNGEYIQAIDSVLYHDIVVNYTVPGWGTNIAAGITNVTDEAPPFIETGFNATTDPSTYRMFGMGYYLRLTQTFD